MEDSLPCGVPYIDTNVVAVWFEFLVDNFFYLKYKVVDGIYLFLRSFKIIFNMPFGNNEDVAIVDRKLVIECSSNRFSAITSLSLKLQKCIPSCFHLKSNFDPFTIY